MFHHVKMEMDRKEKITERDLDSLLDKWTYNTGIALDDLKVELHSLTEVVCYQYERSSPLLKHLCGLSTTGHSRGLLLVIKDDFESKHLLGNEVSKDIEVILNQCKLYNITQEKSLNELHEEIHFKDTITKVIMTNDINANDYLVEVNDLTKDAIICSSCSKLHLKEDNAGAEPKYFTIVGNLHVNHFDGLVGNGDWKEHGVPITHYCPECLLSILPKRIGD